MSPRIGSPSVSQLCERTRRLFAGVSTQGAIAGVHREQVIRELRMAAQRRRVPASASRTGAAPLDRMPLR